MEGKIKAVRSEIENSKIKNTAEKEEFRLKYLSRKGILNRLFEEFKSVSPEKKASVGKMLNELKLFTQQVFDSLEDKSAGYEEGKPRDLTLPGDSRPCGALHPMHIVRDRIIDIFSKIGFGVAEGPEIEDDWHNFTALNFEPDHPAREMQDTFFIEGNPDMLLRTHTSTVQVRVMESMKPPIRILSPGRVYRNEAVSARANCFFHQVEGLYIDENVSFADLKSTLYYFVKEMFGSGIEIRFRPSFFPFTEPSAEMDISCIICGGKGCPVCKQSGWVEILGCGMVDPRVLKNVKINPEKYSGYAFGMGIDRLTMLKYQIHDIRILFENDIRFLGQFSKF